MPDSPTRRRTGVLAGSAVVALAAATVAGAGAASATTAEPASTPVRLLWEEMGMDARSWNSWLALGWGDRGAGDDRNVTAVTPDAMQAPTCAEVTDVMAGRLGS